MGSFEGKVNYGGMSGARDDLSPATVAYRARVTAELAQNLERLAAVGAAPDEAVNAEALLADLLARRDRLRAALAAREAASTTGHRDRGDEQPEAGVVPAPPPPAVGTITPALVAAVLADLGPRDAAALHAWAEQPPAKQAASARDWAAALETRRRAGGSPDPPV